jgi:hypothetical protein
LSERATTMSAYSVEPIGPRTIDLAYPLVRACGCALMLREWRAYCQAFEPAPHRGETAGESERALVARDAHGYVKGFCTYSITNDPRRGRLLQVPIFAIASAADGEGVASDLIGALVSQCDRSVCSGMRFWPMAADSWKRRQTADAVGPTPDRLFLRPLPGAAEIARAVSGSGPWRASGPRD